MRDVSCPHIQCGRILDNRSAGSPIKWACIRRRVENVRTGSNPELADPAYRTMYLRDSIVVDDILTTYWIYSPEGTLQINDWSRLPNLV